ncbi:MAG: sterol desaturase family protein [Proteobacteria bacterium]|nr:sterol desaturase family protein [Pseudomonadota bacterium]
MNNLTVDAESAIRLGIFLAVFLLLAVAEILWPRRRPLPGKLRRWFTNIALSAFNTLVVRLFIPLAGVASALFAQDQGWGLFNLLALPGWLEIALFVLLFDVTIYWQHRLYHVVPLLWRLHRTHHTDVDYDLTTGNRFHPLSILLSSLIKLALVFILGAAVLAILISELLLNITSMFNHSNLRLPLALDNGLRKIVVTPDMHRIHHSVDPREHNKNFGFNFSWWDRLFGSYLQFPQQAHATMPIGITGFQGPGSSQLGSLLIQPFTRGNEPDSVQ